MSRWCLSKIGAFILACVVVCLVIQAQALAAPPTKPTPPAQQTVIRVAAINNPPYVSVGPGGLEGLSISIFNIMAEKNHWQVKYIYEKTQDDLLNAIITYKADIGIGGITPTPQLGLVVDFSDANQIVTLALLVKHEGRWAQVLHTVESAGSALISGPVLALFAGGLIVVFIAGYVIRKIEIRRNRDMFPENFQDNAWWAAQTLIAHNCGSKLPSSERGRYLAMILMIGGTVFTAEITAVLTTSLAASISAHAPVTEIGTVGTRRIATVNETYAQDWLQQNLINIVSYKSVEDCVNAVEDGKVIGAVFDEIPLRRVLADAKFGNLRIVGDTFGSHPHAFVLRKRSPYLAPLNQALSTLLSSPQWDDLFTRWIGHVDS